MILPLALGVALAALLILYARWRGQRHEPVIFAIGLVVAALLYVAFALGRGAPLVWVLVEALGVLPFAGLAWLGARGAAIWLAVGWAVHVGWDVGLHLGPTAPAFVPRWYPLLCTSFDLVVAGYIGARTRAGPVRRHDAE